MTHGDFTQIFSAPTGFHDSTRRVRVRREKQMANLMRHGMAKNLGHGSRSSSCEILSMLIENGSIDSTVLIGCREAEKVVYSWLPSGISQDDSQINFHRV